MSVYVATETVEVLRLFAQADLEEALQLRGHCDCLDGEFCWPHRVLGLLVPTVEAFEPVF